MSCQLLARRHENDVIDKPLTRFVVELKPKHCLILRRGEALEGERRPGKVRSVDQFIDKDSAPIHPKGTRLPGVS